MEVNTVTSQSALCNGPDRNLLHMFKDPELSDQGLRELDDNFLEKSQKSELGNNVIVDSGMALNSRDVEDSSVSELNGDYCGLRAQLSIEYVDIFEILRAEILAAEAREFEVIENDLLNTDGRREEFQSGENGKESISTSITVVIDRSEGQGLNEKSVLQDRGILVSDLALTQDDSQEQCRQADPLDSPKREPLLMQAQLNEENEQAQLLGGSNVNPKDAEGTGPDKGNVDPSDNGKREDGDGCPQNAEGISAENLKVPPHEDDEVGVMQPEKVMSEETEKAGSVKDHQDTKEAGHDGSSNILIVEVTGDAYSKEAEGIGDDKGYVVLDPSDGDKGEDGDSLLHSDKYSEHSEDEEHVPDAFSGPIAFSGMLSYSGLISYSGQIPYSGNLSLHSDSSTSTRSFAFPILASDWNSSPAKIGPPDSRFFRRRRRWRPRFCCRRPTTLFD